MLAIEYCANGDLLSYMQKNKALFCKDGVSALTSSAPNSSASLSYQNVDDLEEASFSASDLISWAYQISLGMAFLESKKVLHGDLAARNVLLDEQKSVKICDFGLSRQLTDNNNYTKQTTV